jgi:DNA-directed RNA polymerase subunit RPC12/RpoP
MYRKIDLSEAGLIYTCAKCKTECVFPGERTLPVPQPVKCPGCGDGEALPLLRNALTAYETFRAAAKEVSTLAFVVPRRDKRPEAAKQAAGDLQTRQES